MLLLLSSLGLVAAIWKTREARFTKEEFSCETFLLGSAPARLLHCAPSRWDRRSL